MAEYHFSAKLVQRSKGQSAIARAAYNARTRMFDERLGVWWDFSRKRDLEYQCVLVPDGVPAWATSREALWNAAEQAEGRRCNAQTARSFDVALPRELNESSRRELVLNFVREQFVARGMVADIAIHRDSTNPHFHLLLTLREFVGDRFAAQKQREWNRRDLLFTWREAWEHHANRALARDGHIARIDHRSYRARGIPLFPQPKLFRRPSEGGDDQRDHVHDRLANKVVVARENGRMIIEHPEVAFAALTSRQSVFSEHELMRLLYRCSADEDQLSAALSSVLNSQQLVPLRIDEDGVRYFSTKEVVEREESLLTHAHLLATRRGHRVREIFVRQAIRLVPHALTDEQADAVRHMTASGDLSLVQGYAGTGKSAILNAARLAWEGQGFRVVGGALTGKAAENLHVDAEVSTRTLRAWLVAWEAQQHRLSPQTVFVLDEAAMVGARDFQKLVGHVRKSGAKLVLVGDIEQLQPIEIGDPMRLLQERYPAAKLTKIIRQRDHSWQREATLDLATRQTARGLERYLSHGRAHRHEDSSLACDAMVAAWAEMRSTHPLATSLLLAFRRADVATLNEQARAIRRSTGELGPDHRFHTSRGLKFFAVNDRLVFLRNGEQVRNGTLGTVEYILNGKLAVRLDNRDKVIIDPANFPHFDHGYATTISKSQGTTVDFTFALASRYMDAATTYVAMSRHRKDAQLHFAATEFPSTTALLRQLSRRRTRHMAHDLLRQAPTHATQQIAFRDEHFVRARTADPRVELAAIKPVAAMHTWTMEKLMENWAEIPQEDRETEQLRAAARVVAAERSMKEPSLTRLEKKLALERLNEAQQQYALRTAALYEDGHKTAAILARRHNALVNQARERMVEARSAQQRRIWERVVDRLVEQRNAEALCVRGLRDTDRGKRLPVANVLMAEGTTVLELRDPVGGVPILAPAESCFISGNVAVVAHAHPQLKAAKTRTREERNR